MLSILLEANVGGFPQRNLVPRFPTGSRYVLDSVCTYVYVYYIHVALQNSVSYDAHNRAIYVGLTY